MLIGNEQPRIRYLGAPLLGNVDEAIVKDFMTELEKPYLDEK